MNKKNNVRVSGGIGFTGLLTIVFIALKLTGNIDWSWLWVLAPMWGNCLLTLFAILVLVVLAELK